VIANCRNFKSDKITEIRDYYIIKWHTVGECTNTYVLLPEASNAVNFGDFCDETFANGLIFSGDDFGGNGSGVASADSYIGLLGIGGGVVGEMLDNGAFDAPTFAPMFRLRCISNSPTCQNINQDIYSVIHLEHASFIEPIEIQICN
jgi:hypothetical protein